MSRSMPAEPIPAIPSYLGATMRTKKMSTLISVAVLALIGTLALNGSAASASTATGSDTTTLRFHVEFSPFNLIDVGRPSFSDGDEIVFHDTLRQNGDRVG